MSSGLPSVLPYEEANFTGRMQTIKLDTHIAGFFFDGIINTDFNSNLNITTNPVQSGAYVSDHAYMEPITLNMTLVMSDSTPYSTVGYDNYDYFSANGKTRSTGAFKILRELQEQRKVFDVGTRLETFHNMMIQSLSVSDDYRTIYGLTADVTLKQVHVVNEKTLKVTTRQQTTETTSDGIKESAYEGDIYYDDKDLEKVTKGVLTEQQYNELKQSDPLTVYKEKGYVAYLENTLFSNAAKNSMNANKTVTTLNTIGKVAAAATAVTMVTTSPTTTVASTKLAAKTISTVATWAKKAYTGISSLVKKLKK